MKKLLVLLLAMVMCCVFFASCDALPPEMMEKLEPVLSKIGIVEEEAEPEPEPEEEPVHEHNYVLTSSKAATCTLPGKETYKCDCGSKKTVELPAGHDYTVIRDDAPSCNKAGSIRYMCNVCGSQKSEAYGAPIGHNMGGFVEYSRLIPCTNPNCSYAIFPEGTGKYEEIIVYRFNESDLARFDEIFNEIDVIISSADPYDSTLHAYEVGSETQAAYFVMEAKYEELYDVLEYVVAQYQIAQIEYHVNISDPEKEANFDYISKVRTDLVSRFYSFSQAIYDSMFREYYYEGMSQEEINAFIFESNAVANPEYKAIIDRNNEIELEYLKISTPESSQLVPVLYGEFVENNKKLANLLGYDNYLEYAYENVYDRDYEYTDVKAIVDNVKKYIAPVYNKVYSEWDTWSSSDKAYDIYQKYSNGDFFSVYEENKALNDYIDLMVFPETANKQLSFSDEFNGLMGDGNMFRGLYQGAYVTSLYGMDIPIAYFGNSYSNFFTVAHEFGHYMNEVYSGGKYSQSYDLLEMHSQGNEMLLHAYINLTPGVISSAGVEFFNIYQNLNTFYIIMNALAIDTFEQAVYTDTYDGTYSDQIMADGKITYDEYDLLYTGIVKDFGAEKYMSTEYWRHVTINAPCYYVSYSISALSVLQLFPMAMEDFDAASDAYLKLFSYVDEYAVNDVYMTTEETLLYAGLMSFKDEELYKYLSSYYMAMFE